MQSVSLQPLIAHLAQRSPEQLSEGERVLYHALTGPLEEDEVEDLRLLIGQYFGRKSSEGITLLFEERGWTSDLLNDISAGNKTWNDLP